MIGPVLMLGDSGLINCPVGELDGQGMGFLVIGVGLVVVGLGNMSVHGVTSITSPTAPVTRQSCGAITHQSLAVWLTSALSP